MHPSLYHIKNNILSTCRNSKEDPPLNSNQALNLYQSVSKESDKLETDPYHVICILLKNAIIALDRANIAMNNQQTEEKGNQISLAISLIDGLQASLDKEKGGDIALNLAKLYDYMMRQLLTANLENKQEYLLEVKELLLDIESAWMEIDPKEQSSDSQT